MRGHKNNMKLKPLIIAVAMALTTQFVWAGDEPQVLDTMVVAASRGENTLKQMPQSTTIISHQEIEQSSAQTVDQLLAGIPGFNITGVPATQTDPTGGSQSTKMRGLTTGGGKVLVLLDGVPIMDPFYMTTQWARVPMANIDHIEVVRGGNSTWGSMAVAGMVNIISKRAKDNSGEVTVGGGSFNTRSINISKNIKATDDLSFNVTANRFETDGYNTTPKDYQYLFPGKGTPRDVDSNFQISTYYQAAADLNTFFKIAYDIHDQNLGYAINQNLQKNPNLSGGFTKKLDETSDVTASIWAQSVTFAKQNGAACYYSANKCQTANLANSALPVDQYMSQLGDLQYQESGTSAIYSTKFKGILSDLQIGADYRRLSATDNETFYLTPTTAATLITPTKSASTYGTGTQTTQALFFQTKLSPIDALQVTLAGRYDNWVYGDGVAQLTTGAGVTSGGATAGISKSAFNPTLGAVYQLNDDVSIRSSVYSTFRAPGFNNETRSYGGGSSTMTVANPGLTPETMTGGEIGTDYSNGNFTVGATYYLYNVTNMIATYRVNPTGWTAATLPGTVKALCGATLTNCVSTPATTAVNFYTNDQNGQSNGLELTGNWKLGSSVVLNGSYTKTNTFLTSEAAAITTPLNSQLSGVPTDMATLGVSWKPTEKLRTRVEARYIGGMVTDNTTNPTGLWYDQGATAVYNASVTYALDKKIDLVGNVVNLFDKQYSENAYAGTSPQSATLSSPRTINVALKARF
jgi:iron complex outermembrane receptor protein